MARVTMTPAQRAAIEESLADAQELREQVQAAVDAGIVDATELERVDQLIRQSEANLRIFG